MILHDYFRGHPKVKFDANSERRDVGVPRLVTLCGCTSFESALRLFGSVSEKPVAIVRVDGSALLMTAGGSGHIWFVGDAVNSEQRAIVDELWNVLLSMGGAFTDKDSVVLI